MAHHDRCDICDYSQAMGSIVANVPPNRHGKVRRHGHDFLCDVCAAAVSDTMADFVEEEVDEEM